VIGLTFNLIALKIASRRRQEESMKQRGPVIRSDSIRFAPASPRRHSFLSDASSSSVDSPVDKEVV
jgi:hypothetical protein